MTTETIEAPQAAEQPTDPAQDDEVRAAIQIEVENVDPGPMARDDDERLLYSYLRLRAQVAAELTRVKDQMGAMIREQEGKLKSLDWVLLPSAERIAREKLHGAKARSLKTPFGTVGFRKVGGGLAVVDAGAVPDAFKTIKREEVINRAELAAHFKATGELPPGCSITPKTDKFFVD